MRDRGRNQNHTMSQYIHTEFFVVIAERRTTPRVLLSGAWQTLTNKGKGNDH
jgi:hypothetical protein